MIRIAILVVISWITLFFAPTAEDSRNISFPAMEKKLLGNWQGGPCVGQLLIKGDGTYERKHYSPANISSIGSWSLHWDALPPTLTLRCTASDDKDHINKKFQYKLSRLNGVMLVIVGENASKALVYHRDKNPK